METFVAILTAILMLAGIVGTLDTRLSSHPRGALLYAWYTGFESISWGTLILLLVLTFLSEALDKGTAFIGARKYGASRWGLFGVLLGGIGGWLLGGPLGLFLGPILGAFALEILHGRALDGAFRAGFGAIIGILGGVLGKCFIALIMIAFFFAATRGVKTTSFPIIRCFFLSFFRATPFLRKKWSPNPGTISATAFSFDAPLGFLRPRSPVHISIFAFIQRAEIPKSSLLKP